MDDDLSLPPLERSSPDKLRAELHALTATRSDDPILDAVMSTLASLAPLLGGMLPDDAETVDELLLIGARRCLTLRSDDAWQPADLNELFGLGPGGQSVDGTAEDDDG